MNINGIMCSINGTQGEVMTSLENLKVFLAVARLKSFTQGAEQLNMPKSTVSRRIKELESHLKILLIQRDQRNFELTDAGQILLKKGENAWAEVEKIFDEIRSDENGLQGKILISTTVDLGKLFLCEPLAEFLLEHPNLKVTIDVTPAYVDLISERVDLAIRVGPLDHSSLYAKKLCERKVGFFASTQYLKRNNAPKDISDLVNRPIISTGKRRLGEVIIEPTLKVNNMGMIAKFVESGAGVGILDFEIIKESLARGEVKQVLEAVKLETVPIYLVYQQKKPPKRVRLLIEKLMKSHH